MSREDMVWALNEDHKRWIADPNSYTDPKTVEPDYGEKIMARLEALVAERDAKTE